MSSPLSINILKSPDVVEPKSFYVKYAGLVPEIRKDIDPCGRTDLLKILDEAEIEGHITIVGSKNDFTDDAVLVIDCDGIKMTSSVNKEKLLVVPLHMLASVGFVKEEALNVVALRIGEIDQNADIYDLALIYTKTSKIAEEICAHLNKCFHYVYHEAIMWDDDDDMKSKYGTINSNDSSSISPQNVDSHSIISVPGICLTETSTDSSSRAGPDVNEYIAMLSASLNTEEQKKLCDLMSRWRKGDIKILEFGQKLLELYGSERKHLLARMRHLLRQISREDLEALNKFLQVNGITENAASATSPLLTGEMSLTTEGWSMSNSATASPRSANSGGGTGIRNFFSRLRKPSDHSLNNSINSQVQVGTRVYDAQEIQKLIPQLEENIDKKDKQLRQALATIEAQTKEIANLKTQVKELQSECDKLRSVLQQKAEILQLFQQKAESGEPQTPTQKSSTSEDLHTEMQQAVIPDETQVQHKHQERQKKLAVSAEPAKLERQATLQHHPKSAGSKHLIREAVQKNDFLKQLAKEQVIELVECMFEMRARAGQWIIQEGEPGDRLFVIAEGQCQVSREGQALGTLGPGTVMGELAILYNCTRTASIQAVSDMILWVLDRSVFQMITMRLGMERHTQLMNFLQKVSIFENLSEDRISKMADVMDQEYYAGGHHILRQGEKGDTFFIINSGSVKITQSIEGETEPREIRVLNPGDFFGEKALLGEEVRTANVIAMNPGVEVLTLDRESFLKLIGDLEALKKDYGDIERRATVARKPEPPSPTRIAEQNEFAQLQLRQLKRIATLGVGGFGRVELVCINGDKSRTFALKALKKKHIVDTRQQEHIFAERNIMMETKTDWIVRLFTTFRDSKYVYMLLEACLGGELWTTLRDRGHFDDYTARFYVACVLEGLEYLHRKNIVYRDLKPENCLLTLNGYLKLVDFGFAKKLASGRKTWTFCGTPEYVSPEIILNKGHDQAADYWALGIYICELMLGRPPFQASDPMKTYTLILKGIDALEIPNRRIGKTATALVKKLCRDNPAERLGSGSGGVNDIRKHRWFMGFDWEGLRTRTLKAPIIPKVTNPADVSNFDNYPPDTDIPPDEFSGWDEGF